MRATVSFTEPRILREARAGDLFVLHDSLLQECVCTRTCDSTGVVIAEQHDTEVVVVACRVEADEIGHQPTGLVAVASLDTWITFVEPVETPAFRERGRELSRELSREEILEIHRQIAAARTL